MKILFFATTIFVLFNLFTLTCSDATFEIRSDIHVAIRLSMRPSPIEMIKKLGLNANNYFKNLRELLNILTSKDLTPPARDNLNALQELTKKSYVESATFFSNDYMTVWYNKLRRTIETDYVFKDMYEIIENFLKTMTSKKAPRCWNRQRESVRNVTQYYVVTKVYKNIETFLFNKFSGYRAESQTLLDKVKKTGPGNSPSFFLTSNFEAIMNLHNRWMDDIHQLMWQNNQTLVTKPIMDETFNNTLPEFEKSLKNASECATAVKPKPGAPTEPPTPINPQPANPTEAPAEPANPSEAPAEPAAA